MIVVIKDELTITDLLSGGAADALSGINLSVVDTIYVDMDSFEYEVFILDASELDCEELFLVKKKVGDKCAYRLMYCPLGELVNRDEDFPIEGILTYTGFEPEFEINADGEDVLYKAKHEPLNGVVQQNSNDDEPIFSVIAEYHSDVENLKSPEVLIIEQKWHVDSDEQDDEFGELLILTGMYVTDGVDFEIIK